MMWHMLSHGKMQLVTCSCSKRTQTQHACWAGFKAAGCRQWESNQGSLSFPEISGTRVILEGMVAQDAVPGKQRVDWC